MEGNTSKVAIVRYLDAAEEPYKFTDRGLKAIRERLKELLDYLGWDSSRVMGKSVLLKPNLVRPQVEIVPAVTTDPRVVLALIDIFLDWGAKKVGVGENPGWGLPAIKAFHLARLDKWVPEYGGALEPFDEEDPLEIDNPKGVVFRHVLLPPAARRYDIIVNIPKLKTHMHTTVSLGIKNLYGFIVDSQRLESHRNDLHRKLVDFLHVLHPDITIIDGLWALEGQAPLYGITVPDMGVLIGSEDIVAVDAVGGFVMGIEPAEVTTTRLAHQEGFGAMDIDTLNIQGVPLSQVRRPFQRAVLSSVGAYPDINVVEGGACIGCQSSLRHSLDRLARDNRFNPRVDTVILGRNAPLDQIATLTSSTDGKIWCFGDCTEELYNKLQDSENIIWVPGCAPHIFDYYLAYLGKPRSMRGQ
ncbi:hypothetical protein AMJ86_06280 [bacterium SM23_57]|nr:MAG: hypothetical protein AMJ86_06280 [bacterium SM23_57]